YLQRGYIQHGRRHGPNGSDPIQGFWRISFGQIDGVSGDIEDPGSADWTIDTDFDGTFTITFDPPFNGIPSVVVSENDTSTSPPNDVSTGPIAADSATVYTYESGSLTDDIGFNFI